MRGSGRVVAILGGTHGNESNGIFVVDSYRANPDVVERPTFDEVLLLTTNTKAAAQCTRFVDEDLNRQFYASRLRDPSLSDVEHAAWPETRQYVSRISIPSPKTGISHQPFSSRPHAY